MVWKVEKLLVKLMILTLLERDITETSHTPATSSVRSSSGCSQIRREDNILVVNCSFQSLNRIKTPPVLHQSFILDMSNNRIDKLEVIKNVDSFANVVSLNLGNNTLVSVGNFFERMNLNNLEEIDLSFNKLTECFGNILNTGIPKVKILNLKGNKIHTITEKDLKKLRFLKSLDLSSNTISKWKFHSDLDNDSNSSGNLESLDLSSNKISELTDSAFVFANGLRELNVSCNVLTTLQEKTFDTLYKLRVLDLSHNKLVTLPVKLFTKLNSLSYLYLSENDIVTLPDAIPILNWFDVSFNKISKIEEALDHVIYPHEVILLGGNPFICDCNILWLKEFYDTRDYLLKFIDVRKDKFIPSCEFPESLKGDTWDVLGDDVFECDKHSIDTYFQHIGVTDNDDIDDNVYTETDEVIIDFKVAKTGTDSVRLEWLVNYAHMVRLTYRTFGNRNKKQAAILPTTVTSFVLRNLDANSPYIICISLTKELNVDGSEEKEKCIEIMTDKHECDGNEDGLILSLIKRLFRKMLFHYQLSVLLALLLVILWGYLVYLESNVKKKEKQK